jgi:hypothetical protein
MSLSSDCDFYFNRFSCVSGINYANYQQEGEVSLRHFNGQATYNEVPHLNERVYRECRKYDRIYHKLQSLTVTQRRMLSALYDQQYIKSYKYLAVNGKANTVTSGVFPTELMDAFGKVAGLSLFFIDVNSSNQKDALKEIKILIKDKSYVKKIKEQIDLQIIQLEEIWRGNK